MKRAIGKEPMWTVAVAIALTIGFWTTHIVLREFYEPGHPVRLIVTGLLVVSMGLIVVAELYVARRLDEFQRQIQLLALAIAFPASLVVVFAVGFFRGEGLLKGADPRDLGGLMMIMYVIGFAVACRRYR